jgi:hypothetical protein
VTLIALDVGTTLTGLQRVAESDVDAGDVAADAGPFDGAGGSGADGEV